MKVFPHIKRKPLCSDEIRVITIDKSAVEELLLENFLEHKSEYFDIEDVNDTKICLMKWNQADGVLSYAVMPIKYSLDGCELDFNYIQKKLGITTDSLFKPNRYKTWKLTAEMFLSGRGQGDTGQGMVPCPEE